VRKLTAKQAIEALFLLPRSGAGKKEKKKCANKTFRTPKTRTDVILAPRGSRQNSDGVRKVLKGRKGSAEQKKDSKKNFQVQAEAQKTRWTYPVSSLPGKTLGQGSM